ncbi:MAG: zf-HC2 domain-containing protein [Planctomycetota bacterium]|nr:zf-HC2 domain-containing protein [Planctomycetota bacterium]
MALCPFSQQLSVYHDGELDAPSREALERHLALCPACANELAQLSSLSRIFAAAPRPRLSQISLHRLHNKTDAAMDDGLVRAARVLSAIAACILVSASVALMVKGAQSTTSTQQLTSSAPPWVDVAITRDRDRPTVATSTPAATWYLAEASATSDDSN